jgi:hypothetical protein
VSILPPAKERARSPTTKCNTSHPATTAQAPEAAEAKTARDAPAKAVGTNRIINMRRLSSARRYEMTLAYGC